MLIIFHMAEVPVAQAQCELDVVPTQPFGSSFYSSERTTLDCAFASSILLVSMFRYNVPDWRNLSDSQLLVICTFFGGRGALGEGPKRQRKGSQVGYT